MVEEEYVLGIVQHAQPSKEAAGTEFCRLRPTHTWDGVTWVPILKPKQKFPDQGLVFWYRPKISPQKGSIWVFQAGEQPHYDPDNRRHDQMQVSLESTPLQPIVAIVSDAFGTQGELRRGLASGSISVQCAPQSRVLLRVSSKSDHWIGPLDSQAATGAGTDGTATVSARNGFAPMRSIANTAFCSVEIDGAHRVLLRHDFELSEPIELFDAQSDSELFRSILKRAKKWNPKTTEALGATRQILEEYVRSLAAANLDADERAREQARAEAAREALREFGSVSAIDAQLLETIVEELLEHPSVRTSLEQSQEKQLAARRLELERQLHDEMAGAQRALEEVHAAVERERENLDRVPAAMKNAVQTMLVDGVNKLAQDVLIQSLLSWTSKSADRPSNAVTGVQPRIISKQAELSAAIAPAADAAGVDAYMLSVATAILGGNGLLLLAGSDANNAAQAAAVLLASNNSCRVAVASTMFGQSDLLSAPCSRVMASDAHAPACRLGEFLREAMSREHVSVVILQGCNRAPLENVLLELLEIKSQSGIERSVEWVDVGGEVQTVRIDRRIAFVGTLTGGPSTFMIPKIMESRIPILWADRQVSPIDETLRPSMQEPTLVAFTHWRSLGNNDVPTAVAPIKTFRSQTATPSSALHLTDYVRRVAAAIGDDDVGVAEAIAALVSGRASKDAQQSIGDSMSAKAKKTFTSSVVSSDAVTRTYCEGSSRT